MTEQEWSNRFNPDSTIYQREKEVRVYATQKNGQLMGSYVSFVVLCIANFAVIASTLSRLKPEGWKGPLPVFVNGDDALFCVPAEGNHYDSWKETTTICGLALSPGKNYVVPWNPSRSVPSFCMINSKGFQITGLAVRHIPYINGGLLRGWTKLSAEYWNLLSAENGIASRFNQLTAGFSGFVAWKLAKKFIRWWSWALFNPDIIPDTVPWYLPESFGGLGFRPIEICGVLCCPKRENRTLEVRGAYGIFCEYRGSQVFAERTVVQHFGDRDIYRSCIGRYFRNGLSPEGITLWRELTKRFKTEVSPVCRKTAQLQDQMDRVNTRGGFQFIFSSEPITSDDIPLGWTQLEQANPLFSALVSDVSDDPVKESEQRRRNDEKFPRFGSESFQWRHRHFLQGVRGWGKVMKRFVHFKLPEGLSELQVSKFLWDRQFVQPIIRGNCSEGPSCEDPNLFLFPGTMSLGEEKWDFFDLDPSLSDQGRPIARERHARQGLQLAYYSMKNKSCAAHSVILPEILEEKSRLSQELDDLSPVRLVRTDETGYDFSEERKLWHLPAGSSYLGDQVDGVGSIDPCPERKISEYPLD